MAGHVVPAPLNSVDAAPGEVEDAIPVPPAYLRTHSGHQRASTGYPQPGRQTPGLPEATTMPTSATIAAAELAELFVGGEGLRRV
jgi:hypothetical protein